MNIQKSRIKKNPGKMVRMGRGFLLILFSGLLGCAASNPPTLSEGHLSPPAKSMAESIPSPVARRPFLAPPMPHVKQETYTVVVNDVPLKELLFALARDAQLNVDIHPKIEAQITINAVNQTLLQILNRIADQVAINYELNGSNLTISPDMPFYRTYDVEYVNVKRTSTSTVSVATQIATAGGSTTAGSGSGGNASQTTMTLGNENDFWVTLTANLESILANENESTSGDGIVSGAGTEGNSRIITNPISSVVTVYATQRQHKEIQKVLDRTLTNAQRQVLIEATIVEVKLGDRYQAGIDWSVVRNKGGKIVTAASTMTPSNLQLPPTFLLGFERDSNEKNISAAVRLLEEFGNAKVLSSPKIIALNNQTALLKVVDEKVYFTVEREEERDEETGRVIRVTYSSEVHTVPVGVVMSVTPQINKNGNVSLSIRPTISRITGYIVDPAPRLANAGFDNLVPEIQVREMESLLQVQTGQTVILGGLMQNTEDKNSGGIPWLSNLPIIGALFKQRDDLFNKTELVIFLRPVVSGHGSNLAAVNALSGYLSPPDTVAAGER